VWSPYIPNIREEGGGLVYIQDYLSCFIGLRSCWWTNTTNRETEHNIGSPDRDKCGPDNNIDFIDDPAVGTDISQYTVDCFLGSFCYIRTVFRLNCLTTQLSYEGRAAVEGGK
jgi:hypothetical protein